ncbi:MAG: putative Ig domain-containing protein, partial [Nitrospira sp.]|nr:putative Ig domain-containing protein [Nitrospira sp.]
NNSTATQNNLSIEINPAPLIISPITLSNGVVGQAYTALISATGGVLPYIWTVASGSLPTGLTLDSFEQKITGTPTLADNFPFRLEVTYAGNPNPPTGIDLSITVAAANTFAILTSNLPVRYSTESYIAEIEANDQGIKPYIWNILSGNLANCVTLDTELATNKNIFTDPVTYNGIIKGQVKQMTGTCTFTVEVRDSSNPPKTATQTLTQIIGNLPIGTDIAVLTVSLPDAILGKSYTATVEAWVQRVEQLPIAWSIGLGELASGLSISPIHTGSSYDREITLPAPNGTKRYIVQARITGTPTGSVKTYPFTLTARESHHDGLATQDLTLNVIPPSCAGNGNLNITTTIPAMGAVGISYNASLAVSNPPPNLLWDICLGSLPDGLSFNPSTGQITGTPTEEGIYNFTINVLDPNEQDSGGVKAFEVIIIDIPGKPEGNVDIKTPVSANRVDGFDLGILKRAFGGNPQNGRWNPAADLNKDGKIDGSDLNKLAPNFGRVRQ